MRKGLTDDTPCRKQERSTENSSTSLAAYSTKKIEHQIRDIEHKQTSTLITTLQEAGVRTLVIGDVRNIRRGNDVGHANNQKLHQWSAGRVRFLLTYKAEHLGMEVVLQEESYA